MPGKNRHNLLIAEWRVQINPYYKKWRAEFRLAGFIFVTPYTAPPVYQTWIKTTYNPFTVIAAEAVLDNKPAFVLPAFVNDEPTTCILDGDRDPDINLKKPYIAFFKGNDDWHYGLRFSTKTERDKMLEFFGEDLGFLANELIGHN